MGVKLDCYGKYKCNEACLICEYESSCRFYTEAPNLRLLSSDHLSLDQWRDDYLGEEDPYFAEEPENTVPLKKIKKLLTYDTRLTSCPLCRFHSFYPWCYAAAV